MSIYTDVVAELVAVGAAIAANCEPCLKYHYKRALELGVSHDDVALAIATAQAVKDTPARHVLALAERLGGRQADTPEASESIESCCAAATAKNSCCG
ncbi:MAG TPA: carboxymuconolactone decarboxylase family protein [Armatimonadota bacterium]